MSQHKGVAQGSPLSPLLANLFLRPFDRAVGQVNSSTLVRYADDLVVLCREQELATSLLAQIKSELRKLKLELHPDKTRITDATANSFEFLGFEIDHQSVYPSSSNVQKFAKSINRLTNPNRHLSPKYRIEQLSALCRSFSWYFHIADCAKILAEQDQRIQERLRRIKGGRHIAREIPRMKTLYQQYCKTKTPKRRKTRRWNGYG